MANKKNPNHELDLELIEKYGFLKNNEIKLEDKIFLSPEKVSLCGEIVADLFKKAGQAESESTKKGAQ